MLVTAIDQEMQKYRILGKKGEGTFSEVLKCQSVEDGQYYACKRMKQHFDTIDQVNNLREIQAMRRLTPHNNVVDLKEVIFDRKSGTLALICELLDMNLYEVIRGKKNFLPEQKCKHYIYQVLKALDHMHRNGIFHRDIKPENILLRDDHVKLADFGSCRSVYSKQPYTEYISTRWYRAPECLLTDGYYTYKMDIWSVGCVFYEILSLHPLFPGSNEVDQIAKIHDVFGSPSQALLNRLKKSRHMNFNFPYKKGTGIAPLLSHGSSESIQIIEMLCTYDPEDRPSAKQVLRQPYFRQLRDADKRAAALARASQLTGQISPTNTTITVSLKDRRAYVTGEMKISRFHSNRLLLTKHRRMKQNDDVQDGFLPKAVSKSNLTNTTLGKPNGVARGLPEIANYTALPKIPVATSKNNSSAFPTSFPSIINKEKKKLQTKDEGHKPYGQYTLPTIDKLRNGGKL